MKRKEEDDRLLLAVRTNYFIFGFFEVETRVGIIRHHHSDITWRRIQDSYMPGDVAICESANIFFNSFSSVLPFQHLYQRLTYQLDHTCLESI